MIIRAKEGTPLENRLRDLYDEFVAERSRALARVSEIFGAEPIMVTYCWGFGFSYMYRLDKEIEFSAPLHPLPPYVQKTGENRYRLSARYKAARGYIKKFDEEFVGLKPRLEEFGIRTTIDSWYCSWQVYRENTGSYVFIAHERSFEEADAEQFDIIRANDVQM